MNKYIFYHSFPINDYFERFIKTFEKIKKSNLLNDINKFYIFPNGSNGNEFLLNEKIETINTGNAHPNESKSINYLRNFCLKNNNSNILYLHAKGVSRNSNMENINAWINLMEYFLIENYSKCIFDLNENDAVGSLLKNEPQLHFSGNFWFANSNYIASLDECEDSYYAPEMWLLKNSKIAKVKSYFNIDRDLYHQKINKNEYEFK
jgi:hypothetical protein